MAWKSSLLVVANVTADSDELLSAMQDRAGAGDCAFYLLVPATGGGRPGREAAQVQLDAALARVKEAGLEIEGAVGDADPVIAVQETWDPKRFDEVLVSTLPTDASRWLQMDLPHRIERLTGCQVSHVVSIPRKPLTVRTPEPPRDRLSALLRPLASLSWGRSRQSTEPPAKG
jgi:hypothetical protein